jgi:cell cycle checkpoint protein
LSATAYLANTLFEEWSYKAPKAENQEGEEETEDSEDTSTEIDINLSILNEVLSIYGGSGGWASGRKNWRSEDQKDDDEDEPGGSLDRYFTGRNKKTTSLRMTYLGEGHPLRLLLYVHSNTVFFGS